MEKILNPTMRRLSTLLLALLASGTLSAGELVVSTRVEEEALRGHAIVVSARSATDDDIARSAEVRAGESTTVALPAGTWLLSIATSGFWSPTTIVEIGDGNARTELNVVRAVPVKARAIVPEGSSLAAPVRLYFQPVEGDGKHVVEARAIDGDELTFELPRGRFDVAVRMSGFTTVHRWDQTIAGNHNLGTLRFARGTTISGRVDLSALPKNLTKSVRVHLRPAESAPQNEQQARREHVRWVTAQPTNRGAFHFNVNPGAYVVQAIAGRFRSEEKTITATDDAEAMLRDVLRLEQPHSLTVRIDPPLDPTGKPWRVTLVSDAGLVTRSASDEGTITFDELRATSYRLDVARTDRDAWYSEPIDVSTQRELDITIPIARVTGTVTLGGAPLGASISFLDGTRAVRVFSGDDGRFAADLPLSNSTARWPRIHVETNEPYIRAAVEDVAIEDGKIVIELPDRRLTGEVETPDGRIARGLVMVDSPDGLYQLDSENGTFVLHGLAPGRHALTAFSTAGETERAVEIEVPDDEAFSGNVRLVLAERAMLRGVVHAAHGTLSGATVFCAPSTMNIPVVARVPTAADGSFRFSRPRSADSMTCVAAASGFATRLLRAPASNEELHIFMQQRGGTLVVKMPEDARAAMLVHNGASVPAGALAYLAGGMTTGEESSFFVEAGEWSLCTRPDSCRTVWVQAGGSAQLAP